MGLFQGDRPDITPAQLVSAVPVVCGLFAAFGIWNPTPDQENALEAAMGWAAALVLGDAGLRAARGFSVAKQEQVLIEEAKLTAPVGGSPVVPPPPPEPEPPSPLGRRLRQ